MIVIKSIDILFMGLHYSQRTYYDDPIDNEKFINVYGSFIYCKHGQPSYIKCSECCEETQSKYCKNDFWEFFRHMFEDRPKYEKECSVNVSDKPDIFKPLKRSDSFDELKKEYRRLSKIHHPDKGGEKSMFQRLQNLYERLCVSLF